MDEKSKQLMESLQRNPKIARDLMTSKDGRELMAMLTQEDHGAALQQAAKSAVGGDVSGMVSMLSRIMQSPEGAQLMERIHKAVDPS